MGALIARCAHPLEKSAPSFMVTSIHRLATYWVIPRKSATENHVIILHETATMVPSLRVGPYRAKLCMQLPLCGTCLYIRMGLIRSNLGLLRWGDDDHG